MPFADATGPGCDEGGPGCCGRDPGPPFCPPTFCLHDCDGAPLAGASITFREFSVGAPGAGVPGLAGVTGSDGCYTSPGIDAGAHPFGVVPTITWDGVSVTLGAVSNDGANCTSSYNYCFDKAVLTISTTAGAVPSVSPTFPFTSVAGQGTGTVVLTYKKLRPCTARSRLPFTFDFDVIPSVEGYLSSCGTATLDCNDDISKTVELHNYESCYVYSPICCPDSGCRTVDGEPPAWPPALGHPRGLVPKNIQVRLTTLTPHPTGATTVNVFFGSDEGTWITVPFVGLDGLGKPMYDTGCRGSAGNFLACGGPGHVTEIYLNKANAYSVVKPYSGTRIRIGCDYLQYIYYGDKGCDDTGYGGLLRCSLVDPGTGLPYLPSFVVQSGDGAVGCTPLDKVSGPQNWNFIFESYWQFEVRELPCA